MNTPPHDYRSQSRTRTPGGLLELRERKDGRRASLSLNGVLLEVGPPARIERRYLNLTNQVV